MIKKIKITSKKMLFLVTLLATSFMVSCDDLFEFELPDTNSKADTILPNADFSYSRLPSDFKDIKFTNLSSEATIFLWDFGSGNTSTLQDPTFTFVDGVGSYPVTLTASDANGVQSITTINVEVVLGPVAPVILGANFDNDSDKNFWLAPFERIIGSYAGMQTTTSSGYMEGGRGGKFASNESRLGYQQFTTFTPNTNYILKYKYRMKNNSVTDGVMNVAIVTPLTSWDLTTLPDHIVAANVHTETADNVAGLIEGTLVFNSANNSTLVILLYNLVEEMYIDSFTLEVQ